MLHSLCVAQVQEESLQVIDGGWKSCPRSSTRTDVLQPSDTADVLKRVRVLLPLLLGPGEEKG